MNIIWVCFLVLFVLFVLIGVLVGVFVGLIVGFVFVVVMLVVQGFFSIFYMQCLWCLFDVFVYGEVLSVLGIWGEIYYWLYKFVKQWYVQVWQVEQQYLCFIQVIQVLLNGVVMFDDYDQIEWCNVIVEVYFGFDVKCDLCQYIMNFVCYFDFVCYLNVQYYDEMLLMCGMGDLWQNVLVVQVFLYGENCKLLFMQDIIEFECIDVMWCDFVVNVLYELKMLFIVLLGFLEMMCELLLNEEDCVCYFDMMEQQVLWMWYIVIDLLVFVKLEGESKLLVDYVIDMCVVFDYLKEDVQMLLSGYYDIVFLIDEMFGVIGVQMELFSVFVNFVMNVICYMLDGGKIVVLWWCEGVQGVFFVMDSGFGILVVDLLWFIECFYCVDCSCLCDMGGMGFGFVIVKYVLQWYDVYLYVQSEEGCGSMFIVWFLGLCIIVIWLVVYEV